MRERPWARESYIIRHARATLAGGGANERERSETKSSG